MRKNREIEAKTLLAQDVYQKIVKKKNIANVPLKVLIAIKK